MQIQVKILSSGDEVLNTWDNKIAVKRKNGMVEIFTLILDDNDLPRLGPDTVLITFGNKEIVINKRNNNDINNKKKVSKTPNDDVELMTF